MNVALPTDSDSEFECKMDDISENGPVFEHKTIEIRD